MKLAKYYRMFQLAKIIFAVLSVVATYLLISIGIDSAKILKTYMSMSTTQRDSNVDRKYTFVSSYTMVTGDIQFALGMGYTEEQAERFKNGGGDTDTKPPGTDWSGLTGNVAEQANKLKTQAGYNNSYYSSYLRIVTVNGRDFAYESQSGAAWGTYKPNEKTVTGAGCFWYASCAAVGAIKNSVYTIEQMCSDLGHPVVADGNGVFRPATSGDYAFDSLAGSPTRLQKILDAAGTGATVKTVSTVDKNKLSAGRTIYVIYATGAAGSSTKLYNSSNDAKAHWTTVIGVTDTGNASVLCNSSRGGGESGTEIEFKEFNSLAICYEVTW